VSAIEFHNVAKHYGSVRAVDDLSLAVEPGELVTVLGPSGSGKSTILGLIAGLTHPTAGAIRIGGRDVTALPAAARNVGLVFQSYALFPNMTVQRNIAFPLRVRRMNAVEIAKRVEAALRLVHMEALASRRPHQLSGGQQQRVAIARAVVFEPDILLLDEPLAALDRKLREEVRGELHRLQRTLGITTLLVTHDQDEALSLSDRVVVLEHGQLRQTGQPEELYLRPINRFVAEFLGVGNFFEGRNAITESGPVLRTKDDVVIAHTNCAIAAEAHMTALLRPENVTFADAGLPVVIRDSVYLGQHVRYTVATSSGRELMVSVPGRHALHHIGAPMCVAWRPADVWLIPETVTS
jgi:putative spermidine/putrescine transport system ATP-binding protein